MGWRGSAESVGPVLGRVLEQCSVARLRAVGRAASAAGHARAPLPTFTPALSEMLLAGALCRRHWDLAGRLDAQWSPHMRVRLLARASVLLRHAMYSRWCSWAPALPPVRCEHPGGVHLYNRR